MSIDSAHEPFKPSQKSNTQAPSDNESICQIRFTGTLQVVRDHRIQCFRMLKDMIGGKNIGRTVRTYVSQLRDLVRPQLSPP